MGDKTAQYVSLDDREIRRITMDDLCLLRFYVRLTPRQRDVLQLVSRGLTNQEIADQLYIEPCVVAGHLTNIYSEMATLEVTNGTRPNRYSIIRLFTHFFRQHPEMDNFTH
jgi:DNA-binding NarL/FixJ family response regulator